MRQVEHSNLRKMELKTNEDKFYKDMSASQNLVERACDGELLTIKELRKQGYLK